MNRKWRRRLTVAAFVYFTFIGGTFFTELRYGPRVAHHILVTVGLGTWVVWGLRTGRMLPAMAVDRPLLAVFAAALLATIFAVDSRMSAEVLWRLGVHSLLFYALVGLFRRGAGRDTLEGLFLASSVVVLGGLFEFASWYFGWSIVLPFEQGWPQIGGLAHPIPPAVHRLESSLAAGFSTGLSAYFAALIPFGMAFALTARRKDVRQGGWLWLVGAAVVEGLSFSRGGLLSLAVSLPLLAALALVGDARLRNRLRGLLGDRRVWFVMGLLVVIGTIFAVGWLRQDFAGHRAGDRDRLELWRGAVEIFRQHPIFGVGPGGYGRALRSVRDPLLIVDRYSTPHNLVLNTAAETGLAGLVALGWLVVTFARAALRRWRMAGDGDRLRIAGAIAGISGFAAQSMVDTFTSTPIVLPVLVMVAYVLRDRPPETTRAVVAGRVQMGTLAVLVVVSAVGWGVSDVAQYYYEQSARLAREEEWSSALDAIEQAQQVDPALGLYAFQRAYILGHLAATDEAFVDDAIDAYNMALAIEGTYDIHRANLAALLAQAGRNDEARGVLESAAEIWPREAAYPLWLGGYAEAEGDEEAALEAYVTALEMVPHWAESGYWAESPQREALLELALAQPEMIVETLPSSLEVDALLASNPAYARGYALRAEYRFEAGNFEGAETDARTAVFLGETRGHYVLGLLAEAAGDEVAAEEHYIAGGPQYVVRRGWGFPVYGRVAIFEYLPQLRAPGPPAREFEPWLALIALYEKQGRDEQAQMVWDVIYRHDSFYEPD